jgi:hypothetical protein
VNGTRWERWFHSTGTGRDVQACFGQERSYIIVYSLLCIYMLGMVPQWFGYVRMASLKELASLIFPFLLSPPSWDWPYRWSSGAGNPPCCFISFLHTPAFPFGHHLAFIQLQSDMADRQVNIPLFQRHVWLYHDEFAGSQLL